MNSPARTLLALLPVLSSLACGGSNSESAPQLEDLSQVADLELLEARPHDSKTLGALHGVIRVEGEVPERFPLGARSIAGCDQHPDVEHLSDLVLVQEGLLQNAYVSIRSGFDDSSVPAASKDPVQLDQRGCVYTPHVSTVRVGQRLLVLTSDSITHNVNLKAPRNRSRNLSMVAGQAPLEFVFRRPDRVRIKCDIHPWMSALVFVSEHPWTALSDDRGAFTIPDVPPGDYLLEVSHEVFGSRRGRVQVQAGRSTGFTVTLAAD